MQQILMYQTADADVYREMIEATSVVNSAYCDRQGISYNKYIGIKRGYHPWQACFNRIMMLNELKEQGYQGWVFYIDADAFIYDLSFDIHSYLDKVQEAFIAAPGGMTGHWWDINDGVFLINLGTEAGCEITRLWHKSFMRETDFALRDSPKWQDVASDQPRLHNLLQANPSLRQALRHEPREFLNHHDATFVRQVLRSNASSFEERVKRIKKEVNEVIAKFKILNKDAALV